MPEKQLQRISNTISFRIALPAFLTILLFVVAIFYVVLPQLEQSLLNRKQEMIMELTETTWSLIGDYHERELRGELSPDEAKRRAVLRIGKLRYGPEKKDYFWINDMTPRMIMHPYRSDLDGKDISDFRDPKGKRLFVEFVKTVEKQGAGYVDYMWQWKDDSDKIVPKISYVKGYEPWGWIVGTGMYIDDVKAEIAAIRNHLAAVSAGILVIISLLALYSIRQSLLADRERQRIFAERGELLKSLEQSTERFRNLIETTSDWIWEIDRDGRCTYSSPRVENLLGFEPVEILHASLTTFAPPDQAAEAGAAFAKLLAAGKPFTGFEITSLGKDGQVVVLECNAVPIFDERGQLAGYRGVARDITERKTAMEVLKKSRDDLHASLEETVASLASTAEKRDPYTAGHQQRVDRLACAIAREIGYPEDKIEGLHIAALLHDIGKITLPSEYLAKPTRLSSEEKALFKLHPEVGYEILKRIQFPWPVAEIVLQHHEHLDGTGYPQGLKDDEILLEAQILAVADVVEAMSSHRPYRPSLGIDIALDEIRAGQGIRYHAESVDACLNLILEKRYDLSYTMEEGGGGVG
ncbi:cache domain-containing protein [Desulfoprunum benzoelyticum]|uniref:PAS domain S-box-containing protein/putative nucleotidyltransferase with HDIG domain n=1 Tax=Desulfoprunum benzoelyticum TaxID=1506996 RepID=A0A840V0C0_9BACT|nr:HD domain-containing phosphohydrolase [Desulfoprunum benzoelyticum]MBB5347159.1 PAS domain S-box-containing protein/putative nucleotidyltransferase with HDIG domain [Desulfoprunum benzoelyticum]MBM9531372.1 cache domain-containing protein [Desulfoprunum benzoelyticum]